MGPCGDRLDPEIGWHQVGTDAPDLVPGGPWFQWHFDRFDVPPGGVELARNAARHRLS